MSFGFLMDGYDSKEIHPHWLTANCNVVELVLKKCGYIAAVSEYFRFR